MLLAISESRRPRPNSVRYPVNAGYWLMFAIIHLLATFIADLFKSPRRLEVETFFCVISSISR
jgi:hypothetical protein